MTITKWIKRLLNSSIIKEISTFDTPGSFFFSSKKWKAISSIYKLPLHISKQLEKLALPKILILHEFKCKVLAGLCISFLSLLKRALFDQMVCPAKVFCKVTVSSLFSEPKTLLSPILIQNTYPPDCIMENCTSSLHFANIIFEHKSWSWFKWEFFLIMTTKCARSIMRSHMITYSWAMTKTKTILDCSNGQHLFRTVEKS